MWAGLAYVWYRAEGYNLIRWGTAALILFNIATAFNNGHLAVISFMGPAFEVLCGGFFLFRALFDLAPRGSSERFLNALLGFAFPLHSLIDGYSLLNVASARERYYTQKDGQGAGDFDQIANRLDFVSFDGVVIFWMLLAVLSLIVPAILYAIYRGGAADEDVSETPNRRISNRRI